MPEGAKSFDEWGRGSFSSRSPLRRHEKNCRPLLGWLVPLSSRSTQILPVISFPLTETPDMSRFAAVLIVPALVLGLFAPVAPAADPVKGNVVQVTLYRGQALVTRVVPIDGKAGNQEIVVSELPEQVIGES